MLKLSDYKSPCYSVAHFYLKFELFEHETLVHTKIQFQQLKNDFLFLNGENLELISLRLDGRLLQPSEYLVTAEGLEIKIDLPKIFELEIQNRLFPQKNTSLEGLYHSHGIFTTQCEAQAFRKITYFLDRPDVMTTYEVTIEADEKKYPVLLSNGNLVSTQKLEHGRHRAIWKDPTKKPSYLFALVAGDFASIQGTHITPSGRQIQLDFYAPHGSEKRCQFALDSLKHSMKWDEEVFGLEYELDRYMVVSIDQFNAGAMENKGLNIFNSRLVLADSETATDEDFELVEGVVAHEYFHNFSGNRITLKNWFHLSLKEGLTVFRDQEFSADRLGQGLKRIQDVELLKTRQFPEDAGPQAHPVLPKQSMAMDNLFSLTIYEKGAEVIRMIQTILGQKQFREILRNYFKKFDGQAITILDFVQHFETESGFDFSQFKNWYHVAGTPTVKIKEHFSKGILTLSFEQRNAKAPLCPLTIPIRIEGTISQSANLATGGSLKSGLENEIQLMKNREKVQIPGALVNSDGDQVYLLRRDVSEIKISGLQEKPRMEYFHHYSAPVLVEDEKNLEDLIQDFEIQTNEVNLYLLSQRIQKEMISALYRGEEPQGVRQYMSVLCEKLHSDDILPAIKSKLTDLIRPEVWSQGKQKLEIGELSLAYETLPRLFAREGALEIEKMWQSLSCKKIDSAYSPQNAGERAFLFSLTRWMLEIQPEKTKQFLIGRAQKAENLTEVLNSLSLLTQFFGLDDQTKSMHADFYNKWKMNQLVLTKWLKVQSCATQPQAFQRVQELLQHPAYDEKNPNCVYSVLWAFGLHIFNFHREETAAEVYPFYFQKMFEIDRTNPQVAARLATAMNFNSILKPKQQDLLRKCLELRPVSDWSANTGEKIISALKELS